MHHELAGIPAATEKRSKLTLDECLPVELFAVFP